MDKGGVVMGVEGLALARLWLEARGSGQGQSPCLQRASLAVLLSTLLEEAVAKQCLLHGFLHTDAPDDRVMHRIAWGTIGGVRIETSIPTQSTHRRASCGVLWLTTANVSRHGTGTARLTKSPGYKGNTPFHRIAWWPNGPLRVNTAHTVMACVSMTCAQRRIV
jgi:hypothetical protein